MDFGPKADAFALGEIKGNRTPYRSLNSNKHEFRLLRISPGQKDHPLLCTLIHQSLNQPQSYEALSYVWGDQQARKPVYIDGCPRVVTENLFDALTHLRLTNSPRVVWIDFVCINQEDVQERASQVTQMWSIYSTATRVVIWLGKHYNGSKAAVRFMQEFEKAQGDARWLQDMEWTEVRISQLSDVCTLFRRSYFRRVWVMQEVAAAKDIIVLCGDSCLPYDTLLRFSKAADIAARQSVSVDIRATHKFHVQRFFVMQLRGPHTLPGPGQTIGFGVGSDPRRHLLDQMALSMRKGISDPRDRIYGVLGILNFPPGFRKRLTVDYTISTSQLYRNFARILVEETHRLDILAYCHRITSGARGGKRMAGLPSWAPDWNKLTDSGSEAGFDFTDADLEDAIQRYSHARPHFDAGGSFRNLPVIFSSKSASMTVKGVCLGMINSKLPPFAFNADGLSVEDGDPAQAVVRYLLCSWKVLMLELRRWATGTPAVTAQTMGFLIQRAGGDVLNSLGVLSEEDRVPVHDWMVSWLVDSRAGRELTITPVQHIVLMSCHMALLEKFFFISSTRQPGEPIRTGTPFHEPLRPYIIGFAPEAAQLDDAICLIVGCNEPIVLRMVPQGFVVIGKSSIKSIALPGEISRDVMKGEIMESGLMSKLQTWYKLC